MSKGKEMHSSAIHYYLMKLAVRDTLKGASMPEERKSGRGPQEDNTPDVQTTLHYIDKLFASYREVNSAQVRITVVTYTLAFVLLALSGGVAAAEGKFAVSGFGLKVPLAVLLTGGAIFIGIVVAASPTAQRQARLMQREIGRLYKSVGFNDPTLYKRIANPFRTGSILDPILGLSNPASVASLMDDRFDRNPFLQEDEIVTESERSDTPRDTPPMLRGWEIVPVWLATVVTYVTAVVFPVAAQSGAGFKVAELLSSSGLGWVWILFILLILVTCVIYWAFLLLDTRERTSEMRMGRRIPLIQVAEREKASALILVIGVSVGVTLGFFVVKVLDST
jgi:hypothetical protein